MNLSKYKHRAELKLIRTIDSCETYEQLKLIEKWVYNTCMKYNIDNYGSSENPVNYLRIKLYDANLR